MLKQTFKKQTIIKFVDEVNENGNTGAKFIDCAEKNGFSISDLGVVIKDGAKYVWNVDGVGLLIEQNGILSIEDYY